LIRGGLMKDLVEPPLYIPTPTLYRRRLLPFRVSHPPAFRPAPAANGKATRGVRHRSCGENAALVLPRSGRWFCRLFPRRWHGRAVRSSRAGPYAPANFSDRHRGKRYDVGAFPVFPLPRVISSRHPRKADICVI
jgi:hypothetical protein